MEILIAITSCGVARLVTRNVDSWKTLSIETFYTYTTINHIHLSPPIKPYTAVDLTLTMTGKYIIIHVIVINCQFFWKTMDHCQNEEYHIGDLRKQTGKIF